MAQPRSRSTGGNQRGEDSRQRVIDGALEVFGRHGYEGATTRMLAQHAGVNLAAIPYYFGGKEGLYRAVAEHVVATIAARQAPLAAQVQSRLADPMLSRDQALDLLLAIVDSMGAMIIGAGDADRWARFLIREQMDPSPAFDILYDGFMSRLHRLCTALVARVLGLPEEDPEASIRASTILGQLVVFRAARGAVQRRLGWSAFGDDRVAEILAVVREQVRAMLLAAEPRA